MKDNNYKVYVHKVDTEDGPMYYAGVSKNVKNRWQAGHYKESSILPYIEKYGWENIEHAVVVDGVDIETALRMEDTLILLYRGFGRCINKNRSGLIWKKNKECKKIYKENKGQEWVERQRQIDKEYHRKKRSNDLEYVERERQRMRDKYNTPEGKIYDRVKGFNRHHPDKVIETPLEARDEYLEYGYIPDYIKNDDILWPFFTE